VIGASNEPQSVSLSCDKNMLDGGFFFVRSGRDTHWAGCISSGGSQM